MAVNPAPAAASSRSSIASSKRMPLEISRVFWSSASVSSDCGASSPVLDQQGDGEPGRDRRLGLVGDQVEQSHPRPLEHPLEDPPQRERMEAALDRRQVGGQRLERLAGGREVVAALADLVLEPGRVHQQLLEREPEAAGCAAPAGDRIEAEAPLLERQQGEQRLAARAAAPASGPRRARRRASRSSRRRLSALTRRMPVLRTWPRYWSRAQSGWLARSPWSTWRAAVRLASRRSSRSSSSSRSQGRAR